MFLDTSGKKTGLLFIDFNR